MGVKARQGLLEFLARGTQARIDGVEVGPEDFGDFDRRKLFNLGQHEHFPLLAIQPVQQAVENANRVLALGRLCRPAGLVIAKSVESRRANGDGRWPGLRCCVRK